jgi:hypothetical protein
MSTVADWLAIVYVIFMVCVESSKMWDVKMVMNDELGCILKNQHLTFSSSTLSFEHGY